VRTPTADLRLAGCVMCASAAKADLGASERRCPGCMLSYVAMSLLPLGAQSLRPGGPGCQRLSITSGELWRYLAVVPTRRMNIYYIISCSAWYNRW